MQTKQPRGGKRINAGRPPQENKTFAVRLDARLLPIITALKEKQLTDSLIQHVLTAIEGSTINANQKPIATPQMTLSNRLAEIYGREKLSNDFNAKLIRLAKAALGIPETITTRNLSDEQKNAIVDYHRKFRKPNQLFAN